MTQGTLKHEHTGHIIYQTHDGYVHIVKFNIMYNSYECVDVHVYTYYHGVVLFL